MISKLREGFAALVMVLAATWTTGAPARDLVVGVEAIDYWPAYQVRDGEYRGAARMILDAYARDRGHRLTYQPLPVKRLLAELIHGGIDLKFPDSPDWQAPLRTGHAIAYSRPVMAYVDGTVVRRDRLGDAAQSINSIGTVSGFTPFAWMDRIKAGAVVLKENPNVDQLLRQVLLGRIDAAYVNVAVALTAAESALESPVALAYSPTLPHIADTYRLSSGKAPEIIADFDDWLGKNAKLVNDIIVQTGAERGIR